MNRTSTVPESLRLVERLRQAGRLKQAAQVCARILGVEPGNPDAYFHLGTIELQVGAYADAVEHLGRAVEQRVNDVVGLQALGAAQEAANQLGSAITSYQRASVLKADAGEIQQGLASALFKASRTDEALDHARRAVELTGSAEARHLLAQVLQQLSNYDEALDCHRAALQAGTEVRRCQVVQAVIAWQRAKKYLEIGVDTGDNLQFIYAPIKLAVDPIPAAPRVRSEVSGGRAQYFEMTSDQFFTDHATLFEGQPVDVVFVDGLHTHSQALKDVENCLKYLADGGVILMHDCNPTTEAMAISAESYEEAVEQREPGESTDWTGDVWKAIVHLRSQRNDVTAHVLDCDYGIGVVIKRPTSEPLELPSVDQLTYSDLAANRAQYLGLTPAGDLWELLGARDSSVESDP